MDEINDYCKSLARKFAIDWISVLCSDWLSSLLLPYLPLAEITRLDSAICYRKLRPEWLNNSEKYTITVSLEIFHSVVWSNPLIDWITVRNLHFCELSFKNGYSEISNDSMYQLAQQCPDLKRIKLYNSNRLQDDKRLQYLAGICDKLENIELLQGFPLSSEDYTWLGACEQLESVKTTDKLSSAKDIKALCEHKIKLKSLEIRDLSIPQILSELGTNCPMLECLGIHLLKNPVIVNFEVFAQGCTMLQKLYIYDSRSDDESTSTFWKDKLMEGLGKNCHLLENLIISSRSDKIIFNITEAALKYLAQDCPLLQTLSLDYVRILSAQGVKYLADHCSMLTEVDFSDTDISDDVMAELGKMRSLKSLDIWRCQAITDAGIDALVKGNGINFESLGISGCKSLTNASLTSISEHCPKLHSISLGQNHDDMTIVGMTRLVRKCQKLVYFDSDDRDTSLIDQLIDERTNDDTDY